MLIPVIIGIFHWKNLTTIFKAIVVYCLFVFTASTILNYMAMNGIHNMIHSHILTIMDAFFLFAIFLYKFRLPKKKSLLISVPIFFIGLYFLLLPLNNAESLFSGYLIVFSNTLVIILSVLFLILNMKSYKNSDDTDAFRIFSIALFMFYSSSFLIDFIGSKEGLFSVRQFTILFFIRSIFYTCYCLLISYSIHICAKNRRRQVKPHTQE